MCIHAYVDVLYSWVGLRMVVCVFVCDRGFVHVCMVVLVCVRSCMAVYECVCLCMFACCRVCLCMLVYARVSSCMFAYV